MSPIRVAVQGALGRMGREILNALCREPDTEVVGATEVKTTTDRLDMPDGSASVPFSADLERILTECKPEVLVDFTTASATMPAVRIAAPGKVNLVIGTTGLSPAEIDEIDTLASTSGIGAVVAPNFALGAVVMMHLAAIAARYLDYAEITELHHDRKADAPSGTALNTARQMARARGKPFLKSPAAEQNLPGRGEAVEGVNIHSVRLPGLLAHQEVLFGAPGQTLTIRHDTISRECFMPGVILAVKEVVRRKGLIRGLDALLGLEKL